MNHCTNNGRLFPDDESGFSNPSRDTRQPNKPPMTAADGRREGELLKERGMNIAATGRDLQIFAHEAAFLRVLLRRGDDDFATLDDVGDIAEKFRDGGKWRGSVPKRLANLGIINAVGVVKSTRPSRHRGFVTLWQLRDRTKTEARLQYLDRLLAAMVEGGEE